MALAFYARARFINNLLPLIQQASNLRRVVTVLAAGKEGPIFTNDFQGRNIPFRHARGHHISMVDMMLEIFAQRAPDVSFVHDYPGPVKSGFGRETNSMLLYVALTIFKIVGPLFYIRSQESGERHLFFATSARFPPLEGGECQGVPLSDGSYVSGGTNGDTGSGVYAIGWEGESAGSKQLELLAGLRKEDMVNQVWDHTVGEFKRVTGFESINDE
ncbi:hypothetical protein N7478_011704 [Penicillium angulare]|uniref:uncharacterized protein n=1 Tax=Penicillium angulare TaxID=116970 RepID=UPI0025412565|nr:uncharacterized protein N7478_011704 [Penicillium angulare]KAJ5261109.1 hypothetical protein N7478_011704 [Penicillium angulare]